MNAKVENSISVRTVAPVDYAILFAGVLLIAGGIFAFYQFETAWQAWLRVLVFIASLIAGAGVMLVSAPGKAFTRFVNASVIELRKVVWPTKQETTQTTMVVIVGVVLVGILLAIIDFLLATSVDKLMGG